MEKRLLLIFFLVVVMSLPLINAGFIGISPAKQEVYFEPNLEITYNFNVFSSDTQRSNEIYVKGDLAEYVTLSRTSFVRSGSFTATLNLPEKIDKPGRHRILIGARETPERFEDEKGIGGLAAIQAPIYVIVPYPGKYAEATYFVSDINKGENATYQIEVHNLGTDRIMFQPSIQVFQDNRLIESEVFETQTLESKEKYEKEGRLDTENLDSGEYSTIFNINYGEPVSIEKIFRVGTLYVNITDYAYRFQTERPNEFFIEVQNLWNSEIKQVYSEVTITDHGEEIKRFRLSFIDLKPWERNNLTGFFDTTNLEPKRYTGNLEIFYENKKTSKLVAIYVDKPINYTVIAITGVIILLLAVIIFLIIRIMRGKKNEDRKKQKKSK